MSVLAVELATDCVLLVEQGKHGSKEIDDRFVGTEGCVVFCGC